jgi:hypothetical protein
MPSRRAGVKFSFSFRFVSHPLPRPSTCIGCGTKQKRSLPLLTGLPAPAVMHGCGYGVVAEGQKRKALSATGCTAERVSVTPARCGTADRMRQLRGTGHLLGWSRDTADTRCLSRSANYERSALRHPKRRGATVLP